MRDNQADIKHEGNMGSGRTTKMSLDLESLPHLQKVMTNMYADKVGAIIREYSTNARDSHIEAGMAHVPIEVTLPRSANPEFIVKDHGTGMSDDEVHEIYTSYGKSTKRDSDDVIGMLGLGCKSALTYTKQFSMVTIKDGVKSVIRIYAGADGAGEVETVEQETTDEPNGVEVIIPVNSDLEDFRYKCDQFFQFWEPGTVLVNGEPVETLYDKEGVIQLDPDVFVVPARHFVHSDFLGKRVGYATNHDYVVMGNVPYSVSEFGVNRAMTLRPGNVKGEYRVVAKVPIGSLNFNPNRETLEDTKRSRETLADAKSFTKMAFERIVMDAMDSCLTPGEAMMQRQRWKDVYGGEIRWHGERVPTDVYVRTKSYNDPEQFVYQPKSNATTTCTTNPTSVRLESLGETVFITGHMNKSVPLRNKQKIDKYLRDNGMWEDVKKVYIFQEQPRSVWLEDVPVIQWDDVAAVELPKMSSGGGSTTGPTTWTVFRTEPYITTKQVEKASCARPIYYSPTEDWNFHTFKDILTTASAEVFVVPKNRWKKFEREQNGIHAREFVRERVRSFVKRLSPVQKFSLAIGDEFWNTAWAMLPHEDVDDPELKEFLENMDGGNTKLASKWREMQYAWTSVVRRGVLDAAECPKITVPSAARETFSVLDKRYPLMRSIQSTSRVTLRRSRKNDLVDYVNAIYAHQSQPDTKAKEKAA